MRRGKRTVMFEYLPGKTYDFGREGVIARTNYVRGVHNSDLNVQLVLRAVAEKSRAWLDPDHRRLFGIRDGTLERQDRYILVAPRSVEAEMFPLVLWCQNPACNRVFDRTKSGNLPSSKACPVCSVGRLIQLRWVRIHRCGALQPLAGYCKHCHSSSDMALVTRGSERISGFRWLCRNCGEMSSVYGGQCRECEWSDDVPMVRYPRNMSVEVHRSSRTFYTHHVVLLNQPRGELNAFLEIEDWQAFVGATFLEFDEVASLSLVDFASENRRRDAQLVSLSSMQKEALRAKGISDEDIESFVRVQEELTVDTSSPGAAMDGPRMAEELETRSGIPYQIWERAGFELLEFVMPLQSGNRLEVFSADHGLDNQDAVRSEAVRLGLQQISLVSDFPITTAVFGFSRSDYRPGFCYLNPFPPDHEHEGKFPIYIDTVQADAVMLRLDSDRVLRWLELNGYASISGTQNHVDSRSYFVRLFDQAHLRQTLGQNESERRMVFGALHTLSHLGLRGAALLCGLDQTSMAEYVLPSALTFAIYSSHRFGATIGAFTALYEQSLVEWLDQVLGGRRCVYDPVCANHGGDCHACTHIGEISCQYFNLNLGRVFLFGGWDPELGEIQVGYLDSSIDS